jgi:chromate reductase
MTKRVEILGFAGSLRKDSYNRALLRAASKMMPTNTRLEVFDLEGIPLFNQDYETQPPEKIKEFKNKIRSADAILIATPEYNYSIPGVLKNAIDWVSRPPGDNVLRGKPVAIMGASTGRFGTARAQYHLRQCFVFLDMLPINHPEVMISNAKDSFDERGKLKDAKAEQLVAELIKQLVVWTEKVKKE